MSEQRVVHERRKYAMCAQKVHIRSGENALLAEYRM